MLASIRWKLKLGEYSCGRRVAPRMSKARVGWCSLSIKVILIVVSRKHFSCIFFISIGSGVSVGIGVGVNIVVQQWVMFSNGSVPVCGLESGGAEIGGIWLCEAYST